ncbi:hypothetical protein WBJ53_06460 [Spirosoma sp. SC4-14]|uniref:hypothetical protein n=1 Tax=Spirosoma sp. SC4-14 TaxID=3128900 RepID=UPI0030CBBEB5
MLAEIVYSIFFGLIDLILFSLLTQKFKIDKKLTILSIAILLLTIFMQIGLLKIKSPMPNKDFLGLLGFSFGLLVLNIIGRFQGAFFDEKFNKQLSSVYPAFKNTIDFLFNKLIYIMIYIYQFLAIWRPEQR